MSKIKMNEKDKLDIRMNGAIFCQVEVMMQRGQSIKIITWGNQKCKGAPPIFMARARLKIVEGLLRFNGDSTVP